MLSTPLAKFLRKWQALETRLHLIFPWKLRTRKEGNCYGRSRVRRILSTCIQLLLLQFLHVIWSMPTIFAFFQKPLDKGFAKLFSWTVVFFLLSMRARARPLFLRTVFQILFRISQSNGKNENPKTDISALKSFFGFRVRLQIRNPDFKI